MRIIRYLDASGQIHFAAEQTDGSALRIEGDILGQCSLTREPASVQKILAPVNPPMIWAIGLNYHKHAAEAGMKVPEYPVVFAKGANCVQNPGDPILLPAGNYSGEVDYECELVVIIGKACKDVSREHALEYVAGYTCGNDVSARDWQLQKGGGQWCRGKSFDTFGPLGPCLVTPASIANPNTLRIQTL